MILFRGAKQEKIPCRSFVATEVFLLLSLTQASLVRAKIINPSLLSQKGIFSCSGGSATLNVIYFYRPVTQLYN